MTETTKPNQLSRRRFIQLSVLGLTGGLLNLSKRVDAGERESYTAPSVLIDIDPRVNNQPIMQEMLGDLYSKQTVEALAKGASWGELISDGKDNTHATVLAHLAIENKKRHGQSFHSLYKQTLNYIGVADYTQEQLSDIEIGPAMLPLQNMIENTEYGRDEFDNAFLTYDVSEEKVIQGLKGYFDNNPDINCANLSFQIGKGRLKIVKNELRVPAAEIIMHETNPELDLYYFPVGPGVDITFRPDEDGLMRPYTRASENEEYEPVPVYSKEEMDEKFRKMAVGLYRGEISEEELPPGISPEDLLSDRTGNELIEITEAYNPEFAGENLKRLIKICNAFPDKFFSVSGGNINSYFAEIKAQMIKDGKWADNLIITAVFGGRDLKSEGSDLYFDERSIDASELPDASASSSATAQIIGVVAGLISNAGQISGRIRDQILKYTSTPGQDDGSYLDHDGIRRPYRVFRINEALDDPLISSQVINNQP